MKELITIIIPTYNNFQYLHPCLISVLRNMSPEGIGRVLVINNGSKESCSWIDNKLIDVVNMKDNAGWTGGIKYGVEHTDTPFVMFLNDDTLIPDASHDWLIRMIHWFQYPNIGMVGPSSNVVAGNQNIFVKQMLSSFYVNFLIGFCILAKREAIEKAGGIDDTMYGGDDFDLAIRMRDAGYNLLCDRNVFVYHHGFKTGVKLHGDHTVKGGWNSQDYKERVDHQLIEKHGFRKWYKCLWEIPQGPLINGVEKDGEGRIVRERIKSGKIVELGCGGQKTIEDSIGLDIIPKGELIRTINKVSVADITHDISTPLPFEENSIDTIIARHLLEHMIDPITCLTNWNKVLKKDGKIVLAVPDQGRNNTIPMNLEHVHGYTKESLTSFLKITGFTDIKYEDVPNGISFVIEGRKI